MKERRINNGYSMTVPIITLANDASSTVEHSFLTAVVTEIAE